jgi:hypothetical protein
MSNTLNDWLNSNPRDVMPTPVYTYAQLGLNYRIPIPRPLPLLKDFINDYQDHKDIEGLKQDAQGVLRNIRDFNK